MKYQQRKRRAPVVVPPGSLPPWSPFVRGTLRQDQQADSLLALVAGGFTPAEATAIVTKSAGSAVWLNSRYQVNVIEDAPPGMVHLSIKRRDKLPVGPERFWDFQRIKTELVGLDAEAVELYPAEDRLIDTSNQYHLWCLLPPARFPFGMTGGRTVLQPGAGRFRDNAQQQPFEEEPR